MSGQYSLRKHSILPLILKVFHNHSFSYLLKDPATKSLVLLQSTEKSQSINQHIRNIENEFDCKLTHSFRNIHQDRKPIFNQKVFTPQNLQQLKPEIIGELSICLIKAAGFTKDYNLIAATHMTPTSTKFPVLFVGDLLGIASIDEQKEVKAEDYLESLGKVKYFPNETYIFPSKKVKRDDLQFAYGFQKSHLLQEKLSVFEKHHNEHEDCLIPTTILEQKNMNPFLAPQRYADILKVNQRAKCFKTLRDMRRLWRKQ